MSCDTLFKLPILHMLWRTQKEFVIILLKVRQLLRHIDVSLLFSKKSLVVVLELARREQVVSCSHKNGWARPEIEKTFFYKQHTQRLSWRTAAAAPPHAVVLQRYRVLKNVVRQGKRRVENCGQILFPAAGPAHPRLCCLCCELEVEKSAVKEDFWIEGVIGGGREPFLK